MKKVILIQLLICFGLTLQAQTKKKQGTSSVPVAEQIVNENVLTKQFKQYNLAQVVEDLKDNLCYQTSISFSGVMLDGSNFRNFSGISQNILPKINDQKTMISTLANDLTVNSTWVSFGDLNVFIFPSEEDANVVKEARVYWQVNGKWYYPELKEIEIVESTYGTILSGQLEFGQYRVNMNVAISETICVH